ncbi:divalent-cation tolerance protein CutA [Pandoraea sp.]|uniref:divalent-cation tolerance protein CutA n=1 Tax=Pandoraea sp. TaxID=1883445 RepID=UPI00121D0F7E|nr:divalent-cation tolerance protein CutA [Pandoraea sp.]MBU6491249.1 divalent cation tolerance protein CutA [Burkholderiales bacterium]MDE2611029.1 divalent-cation tolerance protein CutA [Burkholderiales bacterium]TAL53735.1 MAG: divalent-cation tolerance protein CutA [Pandoraea sp.]TAM16988.1 MAG: divalent-cation tolerance protein CutA [Pandoraea sp.]
MDKLLMVMTTFPDVATAQAAAEGIIAQRLGACVKQLAPCTSTYRWQSSIESEQEVPLLIATCALRYPALEQYIQTRHPYQVPEIVAWPLEQALPAYADWVAQETGETPNV